MPSIFEKIANKQAPAYIIWEDDTHIAFLNIHPWAEGHTLVIPKKNLSDYIFNLSDQDYLALMQASKTVAHKLKQAITCDRVLMWVQGFEVPHVHVHLIPATQGFAIPDKALQLSEDDLAKAQQKILDN